jgi:hypothetical protein
LSVDYDQLALRRRESAQGSQQSPQQSGILNGRDVVHTVSALAISAHSASPTCVRTSRVFVFKQAEYDETLIQLRLFTSKRFHVLLNSLFKVLCNFPSRYLFAIGIALIFSLRWDLPPTLGCTLKQPDSSAAQTHTKGGRMGLAPSTGNGPPQWDIDCRKV